MRQIIVGLLLIFLCTAIYPAYKLGDKLYVHAQGEVNLRNKAETKSTILTTVRYGQKVRVIGNFQKRDTISGMRGHWLEVDYGGLHGYVFDGFLSSLRTVEKSDENDIVIYAQSLKKLAKVGQEVLGKNASATRKITFYNVRPEKIFLVIQGLQKNYLSGLTLSKTRTKHRFPKKGYNVTVKVLRGKGIIQSVFIEIVWIKSGGSVEYTMVKQADNTELIRVMYLP